MRLAFDVVDVFTDRPFAGNQLAVVHGADELSAEQCQAIAREFNFSETTFPTAPVDAVSEYATRIFTPAGEIPFAGHPTLGTAWVLRDRGLLPYDEVTQVCGVGRIGVRFADNGVELTATPRDLLGPAGNELVVALLLDLGLSVSDLAGPVWLAGCGLTFVHVPVVEGAVARARTTDRRLAEYRQLFAALGPARDPIEGINLHHVAGGPVPEVHARVFVPGLSVPEDPATGSAAAGLGMALVASGRLPDGGSYRIRQGVEMGRPSSLHGRVEAVDGVATACNVAGGVQRIASGEIAVPS